MKSCNTCRLAIFDDYGYSNYTTEGTTFTCSKGLHPDGSFDRWFGEEEKLQFAEKCSAYEEGDSIDMDCDRDNLGGLTTEQRAIWDEYSK